MDLPSLEMVKYVLMSWFSCFEKSRYMSWPSSYALSLLYSDSTVGMLTLRATKYMQLSFWTRADSILWVASSMA